MQAQTDADDAEIIANKHPMQERCYDAAPASMLQRSPLFSELSFVLDVEKLRKPSPRMLPSRPFRRA